MGNGVQREPRQKGVLFGGTRRSRWSVVLRRGKVDEWPRWSRRNNEAWRSWWTDGPQWRWGSFEPRRHHRVDGPMWSPRLKGQRRRLGIVQSWCSWRLAVLRWIHRSPPSNNAWGTASGVLQQMLPPLEVLQQVPLPLKVMEWDQELLRPREWIQGLEQPQEE